MADLASGATVEIKPLSVNAAWQGQRFKTKDYLSYERDLLFLLPRIDLPDPPYEVFYDFGVSKASDWDNLIKPFQDILQKKYGFNDALIYRATVNKVAVKRGGEYVKFKILHIGA